MMLISGNPRVTEGKRRHALKVELTVSAKTHAGNKTSLELEEVTIWTELLGVCPRESQCPFLVFPASAFLSEIAKHFLKCCVLGQFVHGDFDIAKTYHLFGKKPFDVNFHIYNSLQKICNLFGVADSVRNHHVDLSLKPPQTFVRTDFVFFVTHNLPFILCAFIRYSQVYSDCLGQVAGLLLRYLFKKIIYLFHKKVKEVLPTFNN